MIAERRRRRSDRTPRQLPGGKQLPTVTETLDSNCPPQPVTARDKGKVGMHTTAPTAPASTGGSRFRILRDEEEEVVLENSSAPAAKSPHGFHAQDSSHTNTTTSIPSRPLSRPQSKKKAQQLAAPPTVTVSSSDLATDIIPLKSSPSSELQGIRVRLASQRQPKASSLRDISNVLQAKPTYFKPKDRIQDKENNPHVRSEVTKQSLPTEPIYHFDYPAQQEGPIRFRSGLPRGRPPDPPIIRGDSDALAHSIPNFPQVRIASEREEVLSAAQQFSGEDEDQGMEEDSFTVAVPVADHQPHSSCQ